MNLKVLIKRLLGEERLGRLDFYLRPHLMERWGGPFNGQKYRGRIFDDIIRQIPINAIVETGTFLGITTARFAATLLPVFTVEANPRYAAYAKERFRKVSDRVTVRRDDSRSFLRQLAFDGSVPKDKVLFYLDAHWEEDLPLRDELDIIFANWDNTVVMIDDFEVPDSDYGYNDYGPTKTLNLSYLRPLEHLDYSVFYPAADASEETGKRRGCVVLCRGPDVEQSIKTIDTLTQKPDSRSS